MTNCAERSGTKVILETSNLLRENMASNKANIEVIGGKQIEYSDYKQNTSKGTPRRLNFWPR